MAIWQFSLHLIPRGVLLAQLGGVPLRLDEETWWSDTEWWGGHTLSDDVVNLLDEVLPRIEDHWSKNSRAWGGYDGDIVEVAYEEEGGDGARTIEDFSVRFDLRQWNPALAETVCRIAAQGDCLLLTSDLMLIEPRLELLVQEIQQSDAVRFVTDPRGFLDKLQGLPHYG